MQSYGVYSIPKQEKIRRDSGKGIQVCPDEGTLCFQIFCIAKDGLILKHDENFKEEPDDYLFVNEIEKNRKCKNLKQPFQFRQMKLVHVDRAAQEIQRTSMVHHP